MSEIKELLSIQNNKTHAISRVLEVLRQEGFTQIEPQLIESYQEFKTIEPYIDDQKLVKLQLPDGKIYTLRPDITSSILNQYVPLLKEDDIVKVSYVSSYYRQHDDALNVKQQIGYECFGQIGLFEHIEMIKKVTKLLNKKITLVMNIPSLIESYIEQSSDDRRVKHALRKALRLKSFVDVEKLVEKQSLKQIFKETIDDMYDMQTLKAFAKERFSILSALQHMEDLSYRIDLSLIPQYDYYSGIYIEGYMEGYTKPVLYGGSYDKRTALYGKPTQAFGVSLDLDMIIKEIK